MKDNSKTIRWLIIFGVWTIFAFFFASQLALQNQLSKNPIGFTTILSWQLFSGYVWFALCPIILWFGKSFPIAGKQRTRNILILAILGIAVSATQQAIDAFILPQLGYMQSRQSSGYLETYKVFLMVNFHFSFLIFSAVLAIQAGIAYYRKFQERELRASQLETRLAQTRLQVLKMQLHPHFLFNTLNAISELIHRDPESAEKMISTLGDLLRISFEKLDVQEVSLKQELEFLKKYLEIEQMRFQDRLEVVMKVPVEILDAAVPNMILQPLVENAIKHGIAPMASGGLIEMEAREKNGSLFISISDNGPGAPFGDMEEVADGIGLSNTRKRLRHLYGNAHCFEIAAAAPRGFRVALSIPFKSICNEN